MQSAATAAKMRLLWRQGGASGMATTAAAGALKRRRVTRTLRWQSSMSLLKMDPCR